MLQVPSTLCSLKRFTLLSIYRNGFCLLCLLLWRRQKKTKKKRYSVNDFYVTFSRCIKGQVRAVRRTVRCTFAFWVFSSFVILSSTLCKQSDGTVISSKPDFIDDLKWRFFLLSFLCISFLEVPAFPFSFFLNFFLPFHVVLPFHLCSTNLSTVFNLLLVLWLYFWDVEISAKVQLR